MKYNETMLNALCRALMQPIPVQDDTYFMCLDWYLKRGPIINR